MHMERVPGDQSLIDGGRGPFWQIDDQIKGFDLINLIQSPRFDHWPLFPIDGYHLPQEKITWSFTSNRNFFFIKKLDNSKEKKKNKRYFDHLIFSENSINLTTSLGILFSWYK